MTSEPALVSMNTASLYDALNEVPDGFSGARTYINVVGTSVFVDDRVEDDSWATVFVGIVDGVGWWAVDVPRGADDRVDAHASVLRAVCDIDRAIVGRARCQVPGLRTRRVSTCCAGDD